MIVLLESYTGMIGVQKLHYTDKCTVLHHPTDMTGVPERKTYSQTNTALATLSIYFLVVLMMGLN